MPQNQWIEQTVAVDKKAEGIVSILTASSDVEVQMISPKGKVYTNKDSVITTGEGNLSLVVQQLEHLNLIKWM